jgi:hypothetical protein
LVLRILIVIFSFVLNDIWATIHYIHYSTPAAESIAIASAHQALAKYVFQLFWAQVGSEEGLAGTIDTLKYVA